GGSSKSNHGVSMRLSKDDILKAADNEPEEVDVPEWGGTVLVRGMTGRERDAFEVSMLTPGRGGRGTLGTVNMRAKLVARCGVGGGGGGGPVGAGGGGWAGGGGGGGGGAGGGGAPPTVGGGR